MDGSTDHGLPFTEHDAARRDSVMRRVLDYVREGRRVELPPFDPSLSRPTDQFALLSVGLEPNDFSGTAGSFRYQLEGEEDLLHLIVTHADGLPVPVEGGQEVASFLLRGLPTALIWLRPGQMSQHFYFGHDELLKHLQLEPVDPNA